MPAPGPKDLGPLTSLIGTWEGTEGVDFSFHNGKDAVAERGSLTHGLLESIYFSQNPILCAGLANIT